MAKNSARKKLEIIATLPPLHPGEVLREEFLVPMELSAYMVAKACGVPRTRIERIAREEMGIKAIGRALERIPVHQTRAA
jgi:antitoxin HigA-1